MNPNDSKLSIREQCKILKIPRSRYYRKDNAQESPENVEIMRQIDRITTEEPTFGVVRMTKVINRERKAQGLEVVNGKRIQRLCRLMGYEAIYPRKKTTIPSAEGQKHPYLKGLEVTRPNQVWCSDITYIPMERGWLYLCAVMDKYSRKILSWKLSNTMHLDFVVDTVQEAIDKYGAPEIFNSDQGSQYTSLEFQKVFDGLDTRISMDGKGRWIDNVWIERFWRTLKYDEIYLRAYQNGSEAKSRIKAFVGKYNSYYPHNALDYKTPDEVYHNEEVFHLKSA